MKYPKAHEEFKGFLKDGKHRITPERFEVLDCPTHSAYQRQPCCRTNTVQPTIIHRWQFPLASIVRHPLFPAACETETKRRSCKPNKNSRVGSHIHPGTRVPTTWLPLTNLKPLTPVCLYTPYLAPPPLACASSSCITHL